MAVRVRLALQPACRPGAGLSLLQARAALYNWLYARHHGGVLALRVEDRGVHVAPGAVQSLCADLRWLGLDWDEGPEVGGAYGPYVQSLRLDLYRRHAHCLPGDGGPDGDALFDANGQPTPVLARVVDDHEMAITHVLRVAQGASYAERERAIYCAFGWEPPQIIDLPAFAMPGAASPSGGEGSPDDRAPPGDGAPLGDTLAAYRACGYLPLALVNALVRLGWTPRGRRALLSPEELAARFDPQRLSHSPATFDLQQLRWFNRRALRALDVAEVTALLAARWQQAYGAADRAAGTCLAPAEWQQTLALALREELDALEQVADRARFAFVDQVTPDPEARAALCQPYASKVLRAFVHELPGAELFTYGPIDAWISALRQRFKAALHVRSRDVMYVLRAALTGHMDGPCLVDICQLLGRERCAERARAAGRF